MDRSCLVIVTDRLQGQVLLGFDLDRFWFGFFSLGDADGEQSLLHGGVDLVVLDGFTELDGTAELADREFAEVVFVILGTLVGIFTGDSEDTFSELDVDVFGGETGEHGSEDVLFSSAVEVHGDGHNAFAVVGILDHLAHEAFAGFDLRGG